MNDNKKEQGSNNNNKKDRYFFTGNTGENDNSAATTITAHDSQLEEIAGELLISRFHAQRLKRKLSDKTAGYVHLGAGYYRKADTSTISAYTYYHDKKFYRVSLTVEEQISPSGCKSHFGYNNDDADDEREDPENRNDDDNNNSKNITGNVKENRLRKQKS